MKYKNTSILALTLFAFALFQFPWQVRAASMTLTWTDNSSNEKGFRIEQSTDGTTFVEVTTEVENATTFKHRLLLPSKQYWYRLRAYNDAGNSGYSNVATRSTPEGPLPLSSFDPMMIESGKNTGPVAFTINDADPTTLIVTATSSNTALVPAAGVVLNPYTDPKERSLTVTPATGQTGTSTITVTLAAKGATFSQSFVLTVIPAIPPAPQSLDAVATSD